MGLIQGCAVIVISGAVVVAYLWVRACEQDSARFEEQGRQLLCSLGVLRQVRRETQDLRVQLELVKERLERLEFPQGNWN